MKYLLDVNALIALGIDQHQFHARVSRWAVSQSGSEFLTSSITEIGFLRIVAQAPIYSVSLAHAKSILIALKRGVPLGFIADTHDISSLPVWVNRPPQITDGHLLALAKVSGAALATLDAGIPGSYVIP